MRPRMSFMLAVGMVMALAAVTPALAPTLAQGTEDAEESWPAVFQDRTEVNVVNVDVVVTDKDGKPITGLQPEDFEVTHNGEPVDITNYFAVEGGEIQPLAVTGDASVAEVEEPEAAEEELPAPEPPRLSLVIYIDEANISPSNRKRAFERLREFLLEHKRQDTAIMVVTSDTGMNVRLPFTTVPHAVFTALDEIQKEAPVGPRFEQDQRIIFQALESVNVEAALPSLGVKGDGDRTVEEMIEMGNQDAAAVVPQIRSYAQRRHTHNLATIAVLRQFVNTAAGLPGTKAVVYVSDGLPLRPGQALYEAYVRRFDALGGASQLVSPETEAARDDATAAFQDLVAHANASSVTFYTLYSASPAGLDRGSAASTAGSIDMFGTYNSSFDTMEAANAQDAMVMMAAGTGGKAALSPAAFAGVLEDVYTDFENRYSLGFATPRLPSGERRKVEVRIPGHKEWRVRYRDSFSEKTPDDKVAARTLSALLLKKAENPLEITLTAQEEKPGEKKNTYVVPLRITVPLGKLVLLPGQTMHQAQVSMFVAALDEKGRTSPVIKHLCPIRIPNTEVLTALGRSATCGVQLMMRGGDQTVAVSLRDELAAVESTARLQLKVPGVVEEGATAQLAAEGAR